MTAYTDLQTAASTLDTTLATLVNDAKDFFAKAAVYESTVQTGSTLDGQVFAGDSIRAFRAAMIKAIVDDADANAYKLAKALRLPIRVVGVTAASLFP